MSYFRSSVISLLSSSCWGRAAARQRSMSVTKTPEWKWDPTRRMQYWLDNTRREYVFQDGSRVPFEQRMPRSQEYTTSMVRSFDDISRVSEPRSGGNSTRALSEPRNQVFQRRSREFYRRGRVFAVRPPQNNPAGSSATVLSNLVPHGSEAPIAGVLRYVIISEPPPDASFCWALPISSYRGEGTRKAGVLKHEHGVIYSGRTEPDIDRGERPSRGERAMMPNAIRITPHLPSEKLHHMSRINYGQPTRVSTDAEVHEVGSVHRDSEGFLLSQYRHVTEQRLPQTSKT